MFSSIWPSPHFDQPAWYWYSLVFISPLLLHLLGLNGVRRGQQLAVQPLNLYPCLCFLHWDPFWKQVGLYLPTLLLVCSSAFLTANAVYDFLWKWPTYWTETCTSLIWTRQKKLLVNQPIKELLFLNYSNFLIQPKPRIIRTPSLLVLFVQRSFINVVSIFPSNYNKSCQNETKIT